MKNTCSYSAFTVALGVLCCLLPACTGITDKKAGRNQEERPTTADNTLPNVFRVPDIPLLLNTPEARADFLMAHYWDCYDFTDTSLVHQPEYSRQAFANFVYLLNNVPPEEAEKGVRTLTDAAAGTPALSLYFSDLAEQYLYDPNAPGRNEDLFELFLKAQLENRSIDQVYRQRARYLLNLIRKNKTGSAAADFTFTLSNGTSSRLSALRAPLILLYFHHPDCHECKRMKAMMQASGLFKQFVSGGRLLVLALYPDEDPAAFRAGAGEVPPKWIYAYDKGETIKKRELYDLKAIPTLYLLDENKKVLLKDVPFGTLEDYLAAHR